MDRNWLFGLRNKLNVLMLFYILKINLDLQNEGGPNGQALATFCPIGHNLTRSVIFISHPFPQKLTRRLFKQWLWHSGRAHASNPRALHES